MDTTQISNILQSNCELAIKFCGVFACDRLPITCDKPTLLVANTDPHNKPGAHWVAIYIDNTICEYFDSYGLPPTNKHFLNFLKRNGKRWRYSTKQFQNEISDVCGHYCVWFLSERARGQTTEQIQTQFGNNTIKNDFLVEKFVIQKYGNLNVYKTSMPTNCQCCQAKHM